MAQEVFDRPVRVRRRPFYPLLLVFAASCFLGALATDLAYWRTADIVWADFSDWLVTVGVIVGYGALVFALIEIFVVRRRSVDRPSWPYALAMIAALILATFDMFVHTRDAWTSVVPWGVLLTAAVVVVVIVAACATRATYEPASETASSKVTV